jgi:hypothetical protein
MRLQKRLLLLFAVAIAAVSLVFVGIASGDGSASDRSFQPSLAPSVPSDPAFHGVTAGGAPWLLRRGFVTIGGRGNFELLVRGLVLTATGTAGPVTTISASLFCGGDSEKAAAATTSAFPLSQAGDGRIRAKLTLPDTCLAPIVLVHPNGGVARYIAVTGWKS